MDFATEVMNQVQSEEILASGESVGIHQLNEELFEINFGQKNVLLTKDAGLDLMFSLAEFMSHFEGCRK